MSDLNEIDKVTYTMDFLQLIAYGAGFANLPTTAAKDIASRMKDMWKSYQMEWF